jgi:uncharacterized protein (DUF305 family)
MKSYGAATLVFLVAFTVNACGGSASPAQTSQQSSQPVITGSPAWFNFDDVEFAVGTAASYGQTSDLTALVPQRSADPRLVAFAADIDAAQVPNLETVKVFLVQWNSSSDNGPSQGGVGRSVPGTLDDATMAQLSSLSGKGFDAAWLRAMIGHQKGAVAMARAEVDKGSNVDAVATAKRLVGTYESQISRLQGLLRAG